MKKITLITIIILTSAVTIFGQENSIKDSTIKNISIIDRSNLNYENLRESIYDNSFSGDLNYFLEQEKLFLGENTINLEFISTLSNKDLKKLIELKTSEAEYLYLIEKDRLKKLKKKEKKNDKTLIKIKADNKDIITFIRKNQIEELYYPATEYSLAMIDLLGDAGKVHSMQASAFMRKNLREDKKNIKNQVHYGTYLSFYVNSQKNYRLNNMKSLALKMLNDDSIKSLDDKILKYRAYCFKSALYMKSFDSEKAYYYYNKAKEIFPDSEINYIAGIYYSEEAEKNEEYNELGFGKDIAIPYYVDVGLFYRKGDLAILSPYIGVGMHKTFFSSSWFVETGLKLFYKNFRWDLGFQQAVVPSFSTMNSKVMEYYGTSQFSLSFNKLSISTKTSVGKLLFAKAPLTGENLKANALKIFAVKQDLVFDFTIYDDGFNYLGGIVDGGIYHIPSEKQTSGYINAKFPMLFNFGHSELGMLPQLMYSDYISGNKTINVLNRNMIYRGGMCFTRKKYAKSTDLLYKYYELNGAMHFTYRVFFTPLQAPADRLYISFNFSTGFGTDLVAKKTDALYSGGLSFGFELHDISPFEFRFEVDQNKHVFFMMTVLHPAKHSK